MRQITPPVTFGRSLPNLALSASTACPDVDGGTATAAGAEIAGAGAAPIGGESTEGGKAGAVAGPDGGARLIAPPPTPSGSGTIAGGTGGGRSPKICAETGAVNGSRLANASAHNRAVGLIGRPAPQGRPPN